MTLTVCGIGHGPLCHACAKIHNDEHAEKTKRDTEDPKVWRDLARGDLED